MRPTGSDAGDAISEQEALEIGVEAYHFFYPLVLMDVTRRQMTNVEAGTVPGSGPMNTFGHFREFPTAAFRAAPRPNFDTLYSIAWLDLTRGPVIVSAPDTAGRYCLLPMLDMSDEVFAVPGKRTSGTRAGHFGVVPPGWQGEWPAGVEKIRAATPHIMIAGRTQTNSPADYEAVHRVQDGYVLTPLSQWGQQPRPVAFTPDPTVDMRTEPVRQVNGMSVGDYFAYAAELLKLHPPHLTDWSMLTRLRRIGIQAGRGFDFARLAPDVRQPLAGVPAIALERIQAKGATFGRIVNGWQMITETIGVYGNNYLKRAWSALIGVGFNQPEDAIYPINVADADGQPLSGENNYLLHFAKDELPPVEAFWSVTMYDADGYIVPNSLNRYALGDRDPLRYNDDGSLDLYLQPDLPGPDRESNWLPAPRGPLGVYLRLYATQAGGARRHLESAGRQAGALNTTVNVPAVEIELTSFVAASR
jgi:hypothetical protein